MFVIGIPKPPEEQANCDHCYCFAQQCCKCGYIPPLAEREAKAAHLWRSASGGS